MSHPGKIISIEGIDAVGKLTQSRMLEQCLVKSGHATCSLSFPDYETGIGKEIKAFLLGGRDFLPELRHMLFAANRWEKVQEINMHRQSNEFIIIDRYSESNLVYGIANGLELNWLEALEAGIPKSDLVLVLDAPATNLLARRLGNRDKYEKDSTLQLDARTLYKRLAPEFGWTIVDASGEIEEVHNLVKNVVKRNMTKWRRNAK